MFQYRWTNKNQKTGEETHKVHYGITSLNPEAASVERLLAGWRGHWSIETSLTGCGGRCSAKMPPLSDVVQYHKSWQQCVGRFAGWTTISGTIKYLASNPKLAVNLIK
ncbi:hypothetical protein C6501_06660 [Candidatus Poribacteria bacterium]|nr:MAG: hypothetical protein C6501_06660 [Candidatus Poribacteria bacterium]